MSRNKSLVISLALIVAYGVSWLIRSNEVGSWLFLAFGLCAFILPGYSLTRILKLEKYFERPFDFILSLSCSIAVVSALSVITFKIFRFDSSFGPFIFLLATNLAIAFAAYYFKPIRVEKFNLRENLPLLITLAAPLVIFLICYKIYPFFVGDDTYVIASSIRQTILSNHILQVALERRPLFTPAIIFIKQSTGLSVNNLLIFFLPILSMLSFTLPIVLLKEQIKKNSILLSWGLLFLASPYLFFQLQYSIPQSLILIFTFPVLLCLLFALKNEDLKPLIFASALSLLSITFHELGTMLVAVSIITWIIFISKWYKQNRSKTIAGLGIFGVIALPYLMIMHLFEKIKAVAFLPSLLLHNLSDVKLRLWYVSHYTNPDGIIFSYPGFKGVIWYCYLGASILVPSIILLWIIRKRVSKKILINYSPLIFYIVIFFLIAEIYPRIAKIAFLPERAWPFLVTGLSLMCVLIIRSVLAHQKPKNRRWFGLLNFGVILIIIFGAAGSIYLSTNRGILLSKQERAAMTFVQNNTPENSTLTSTQAYDQNFSAFAGRDFVEIPRLLSSDINPILAQVKSQVKLVNQKIITKKETAFYSLSGEKLESEITDEKYHIYNESNVYFIFSDYRFKNTGFVGNPNYLSRNDIQSQTLFDQNPSVDLKIAELVYNQDGVKIYKIK